MKRLLLALCLLLPMTVQAQKKENFFTDLNDFLEMRSAKNYARQDTNYVARYPYIWDTRTFYYVTSLHIKSEGAGDVDLYTGVSNRVGLSFGYRGLALSYSFALGRKLNVLHGPEAGVVALGATAPTLASNTTCAQRPASRGPSPLPACRKRSGTTKSRCLPAT